LEPSQPRRLVDVGLAYARAGDYDNAITTLGRAAQRYPETEAVYVALGRVWLTIGDTQKDRVAVSKALQALESAAGRPDATSDTLTLYGRALLLADRVDDSERVLQQASATLPVDPAAFYYLSSAAQRHGHVSAARDAMAKYKTLVGQDTTTP